MSEPVRLRLATETLGPQVRPGRDPIATADYDMAHRIALWLADVSAETTVAPLPPPAAVAARPTARPPRVEEPPR